MSSVLAKTRQQQIEVLRRIGCSLLKIEAVTGVRGETISGYLIEAATRVRSETISGYLAAAGIPARRRGGRVADLPPANPGATVAVSTDSVPSGAVIAADPVPGRAPTASAFGPQRELIVEALSRGRNAMAIWQELLDGHGFTGR